MSASISYAKDQIVIKCAMEKPWLCSHMQHLSACSASKSWGVTMVEKPSSLARRCGGTKKPGRFPAADERMKCDDTCWRALNNYELQMKMQTPNSQTLLPKIAVIPSKKSKFINPTYLYSKMFSLLLSARLCPIILAPICILFGSFSRQEFSTEHLQYGRLTMAVQAHKSNKPRSFIS